MNFFKWIWELIKKLMPTPNDEATNKRFETVLKGLETLVKRNTLELERANRRVDLLEKRLILSEEQRDECTKRSHAQEREIEELNERITAYEAKIQELSAKIKHLEAIANEA